jgi:hypothetical protein
MNEAARNRPKLKLVEGGSSTAASHPDPSPIRDISALAKDFDRSACSSLPKDLARTVIQNSPPQPSVSKASAFVLYLRLFEHLHTEYKGLFNRPRRGCDRDSLGYAKSALSRASYYLLKSITGFEIACNNDNPAAWQDLRNILENVINDLASAAKALNVNYRFADHTLVDRCPFVSRSISGEINLGTDKEVQELQDYVHRLFPLMNTYAQAYNGIGHHIVGQLVGKEHHQKVTVRMHINEQTKRLIHLKAEVSTDTQERTATEPY